MVLKEVKAVLFLLFVVATAGLLMRSWNWAADLGIDFYSLRQAHSHLAFLGWVFPAIIILYNRLFTNSPDEPVDKFLFWIFIGINVLMFGAFIQHGYTGPSIILLSVHTALAFTYAWRFLSRLSANIKGGTRFLVISSIVAMCVSFLGPLAIPVIKNTGGGPDQMKLAIHFYLHFQYNAFFVLAILALMARKSTAIVTKLPAILTIAGMCGTYFVTVSWGIESEILNGVGSVGGIIQFIGVVWLLLKLNPFKHGVSSKLSQFLMFVVVGSLVLKCALQVGANWFPQLSLGGGLHFWVIAFLHLIFLGVVTPYLLFQFFENELLPSTGFAKIGIGLLLFGVIGSEMVLGLQGAATFSSALAIEQSPYMLVVASVIIWFSIGMLLASSFRLKR